MRAERCGGTEYFRVYRIYVTEPCLMREDVPLKPGCTRGRAISAVLAEGSGTYSDGRQARKALKSYCSTLRRNVTATFGNKYNIVQEYYAQCLLIDRDGKVVNVEEERIYSGIKELRE